MNIEGWGGRTGVKVDKKSPASQWNVKHNNSEAGFVVPAPKSSERRRMGSSASVPQCVGLHNRHACRCCAVRFRLVRC
jgi:hypothetical protein